MLHYSNKTLCIFVLFVMSPTPGFPEFWYTWRHQLKAFSEDFDAVAIDMRGYGMSSKPQVSCVCVRACVCACECVYVYMYIREYVW